jgi:hypothetical protein
MQRSRTRTTQLRPQKKRHDRVGGEHGSDNGVCGDVGSTDPGQKCYSVSATPSCSTQESRRHSQRKRGVGPRRD